MKISTKGRYGLRALIDLVMNAESESVTIKTIAERQGISERYLEQIFASLRKAGVIIGRKGAQGGYVLAREPKDLTIGDILRILEGDTILIDINNEDVNDLEYFINDNLWKEINERVREFFDSITLEEFIQKYKDSKNDFIYCI